MARKLNDKQEKFCREYVKSGNATAAMLEAYPSRRKWSENARNTEASRLANNPKIIPRLDELRKEAKAASDVTRDEILGILAAVIRGGKVTDYEQETVSAANGSGSMKRFISVTWAIERLCKMCGFDEAARHEVVVASASREELEQELRRLESLTVEPDSEIQ